MPLGKNAKAGTYVDDFVHSKNSKFNGKSKKERIKMALGAFYGKKNEDIHNTREVVSMRTPIQAKAIDRVANDNPKRASKVANDNKPKQFEGLGELANHGLNVLLEKRMSTSEIEKKAHKGENVGHGGFKKVEASAAKEYGSKKAGERVAAAVMFKKYGKK